MENPAPTLSTPGFELAPGGAVHALGQSESSKVCFIAPIPAWLHYGDHG
jgi:hypothetical protein